MRENLIEKLKEKFQSHDTTNFIASDFIHAFGSSLEALMYSVLFWPDFVELDGMVFWAEAIEDQADRQHVKSAFVKYGSRSRTEKAFNFISMPSLFARLGTAEAEEDRALAARLAEMWQARLEKLYPSRTFRVEVTDSGESNGEPGILFYQVEDS